MQPGYHRWLTPGIVALAAQDGARIVAAPGVEEQEPRMQRPPEPWRQGKWPHVYAAIAGERDT